MSHVRVWKFRPPPEREPEFAVAYPSNGEWAGLFSGAQDYRALGAELEEVAGEEIFVGAFEEA